MHEEIECIDWLLDDIVHMRCPNYQVRIFVRQDIFDAFFDFLAGEGINPKYKEGDIDYRFDKFLAIAVVICRNRYRDDLYRIEDRNPTVTAMKFMDKGRNDRVYCQEIKCESGKAVVICKIHNNKKNQKNQHKEKQIIKKVGDYEFEVFD